MGSGQYNSKHFPPDDGSDDYGCPSLFGPSSLVEPHPLRVGGKARAILREVIETLVTGGEPYKDRSKGNLPPHYKPGPCWVYTPREVNGQRVMVLNFERTVELSSAGGWTRWELINLAQQQDRITSPQVRELRNEGSPGGLEARLARKA